MKNILLVVFFSFIAINAFSMHRKNIKKQDAENRVLSATIRYSGCFGKCTEYSVEVNSDGYVIYTGIRYSKDSGAYKKQINKAEAKRILHLFETYKVDTCAQRYRIKIHDIQTTYFTIKYANETKMIANANFGPLYFQEITLEMNNIGKKINDEGWEPFTPPDTNK